MDQYRIAFISDVHGNSLALRAVLADIKRRNVDQIINMGDTVYGPIDPKGTAKLLRESGMIHIRGNQDRVLLEEHAVPSESMQFVISQLSDDDLNWIREMPTTLVVHNEIFLCHATPGSDETYLVESVTENGVSLRALPDISEELASVAQPVVVCGHSHIPRTTFLPNGKLIINPGSVGLPAYEDELPFPHKMESGSPHAKYSVLTKITGEWKVEHITIPYDWEKAAELALRNNRADWARALISGRA